MASPYKKIHAKNTQHVVYVSTKVLKPHKLYKMVKIIETNHDTHGKGYKVELKTPHNKTYQTYIPPRYIATLDVPDDIECFKNDILNKKILFTCSTKPKKMADKAKEAWQNQDDWLMPEVNTSTESK